MRAGLGSGVRLQLRGSDGALVVFLVSRAGSGRCVCSQYHDGSVWSDPRGGRGPVDFAGAMEW